MKKTTKLQQILFSDDSLQTDHSVNSSVEYDEKNSKDNYANKFNQLKETMNQLFLANPELADDIKFDRELSSEEEDIPQPHMSQTFASAAGSPMKEKDDAPDKIPTSKFWGVMSKNINRQTKSQKVPSLAQINHNLNIFKANMIKVDPIETLGKMSTPKNQFDSKNNTRVMSAKSGMTMKNMNEFKSQLMNPGTPSDMMLLSSMDEQKEGVTYFSYRRNQHMKLKEKRMQQELIEKQQKREAEAVRKKLEQEREKAERAQKLGKSFGAGDGGNESQKKLKSMKEIEANQANQANKYAQKSKANAKTAEEIIARLTKDAIPQVKTEEEEEKKMFVSEFANLLHKEMREFGDADGYRRIAIPRVLQHKKEVREKLAKSKCLQDNINFTKEKFRNLNLCVPEITNEQKEVTRKFSDTIFVPVEINKPTDEAKEENMILLKMSKMSRGNILHFWKDAKDQNQ